MGHMNALEPDPATGPDAARWVRLERRLDASAERVFRAWSDPEELARWLPDRIEGSLGAGTRSELVWAGTRVWWDVIEVHPDDTFTFRRPWGRDEALVTHVRIGVEPVGYGSRVTLEDGPFPIGTPAGLESWAEAIRTWSEALTMLRANLDFSVDVRRRS
jgi:uncharacterized protein YndB with AHSA1/START domain